MKGKDVRVSSMEDSHAEETYWRRAVSDVPGSDMVLHHGGERIAPVLAMLGGLLRGAGLIVSRKPALVADDGFDRFWAAFPRRVKKKDAMKAWADIQPDRELVERIVAALEWQRSQPQWTRDAGSYIPYPASWLRAEQWTDEPFHAPAPKATLYWAWSCPHAPRCGNQVTCGIVSARKKAS